MDPIALLKARLSTQSQRELAAEMSCSEPYLSDVLRGRRGPGPKILAYLGLEVTYRKINGRGSRKNGA
jgi:transcriptional regulator with XRE-family HTH domain